jgi:hypothetical protein
MKNTSATYEFNDMLANGVNGEQVAQETQSLYDFYKSLSYTCSVEMLGCALMQPTMYFQLRHVPLFYGPYQILEVKHTINATKFSTSFDGVRQSKYEVVEPDNVNSFVRKNYLENYKSKILERIDPTRTGTSVTTFLDPGEPFPDINYTSDENCKILTRSAYRSFPFVSATTTTNTFSGFSSYLGTLGTNIYQKIYIMGKILCSEYNKVESFDSGTNRNIPDPIIKSYNQNPLAHAATAIFSSPPSNELICVGNGIQSVPLFSYNTFTACLDVEKGLTNSYPTMIEDIKKEWDKTQTPPGSDERLTWISGLTSMYLSERSNFLFSSPPPNAKDIKDYVTVNLENETFSKAYWDSCRYNFAYAYDKFFFKCLQPNNAYLSAVTATSLTFAWSKPSYYGVEEDPANGYDYIFTDTNITPTNTTPPDGTYPKTKLSNKFTSLTPDKTYYFWIRSVCALSDRSDWLGPLPARTTPT